MTMALFTGTASKAERHPRCQDQRRPVPAIGMLGGARRNGGCLSGHHIDRDRHRPLPLLRPRAISDPLEQVDQSLDALGAGAHPPEALDQAFDVRIVQWDALDELSMNLQLDRCPSGHGEGPARLPTALPRVLV